jgi:hypothetical protein
MVSNITLLDIATRVPQATFEYGSISQPRGHRGALDDAADCCCSSSSVSTIVEVLESDGNKNGRRQLPKCGLNCYNTCLTLSICCNW